MSELEIEFQSEIKSRSLHLELFHSIRPMQVGFPIDIYLPYMNIISRMSDVVEFWPQAQVNQVIQSNLEIMNHIAFWQRKKARKILPLIFLLKRSIDYIVKKVQIRKK